jgi:hypothetical protein
MTVPLLSAYCKKNIKVKYAFRFSWILALLLVYSGEAVEEPTNLKATHLFLVLMFE